MAYINRKINELLEEYLQSFPVVAILGPRQCGKSTLVKELLSSHSQMMYMDLEKRSVRTKLSHAEQFFLYNAKHQICLDEIQLMPKLFSTIRSVVDEDRRPGRFVILGSASRDLLQQSSETLAGRIGYLELTPFFWNEVSDRKALNDFWFQGGFPDSFLATNKMSKAWRSNFIRTFLERDIPQMGFNIPVESVERLWRMLAVNHAQAINLTALGTSLGVSHTTVRSYIDILSKTFMVRELKPLEDNLGKRLIKTPKVYIRDTGMLHSLLNIADFNELFSHPIFGYSWEGLVIENVCTVLGDEWDSYFYRTSHGAEMDLVMRKGNMTIAIECKVGDAPKVTRGFWQSIQDIGPNVTYVVSPLADKYPIEENVWGIGLPQLVEELLERHQ